jgi:hypothetical protein
MKLNPITRRGIKSQDRGSVGCIQIPGIHAPSLLILNRINVPGKAKIMHIPEEAKATMETHIKIVPIPLLDGFVNVNGPSRRIARPETSRTVPKNQVSTEIHWENGVMKSTPIKNNKTLTTIRKVPNDSSIKDKISPIRFSILSHIIVMQKTKYKFVVAW